MPTFKEKLTRWEILSSNLRGSLQEYPSLHAPQAAFAAIVAEGLSLVARQDAAEAEFRSLIERRNDLERRGNHAREYLVAALRDALGVSNPLLLGFNIRPRVPKRKPRPAATKLTAGQTDLAPEETPPPAVADEPQIH